VPVSAEVPEAPGSPSATSRMNGRGSKTALDTVPLVSAEPQIVGQKRFSAEIDPRKPSMKAPATGLPDAGHGEEDTKRIKKKQGMFVDPKKMKDKLRENMKKPRYDVTNFYFTEGYCQEIARHHLFENITLGVIAFNALWISIDTDNNNADALVDADAIFILAENFFCIYFAFEWAMRFGAFKNKLNCFKDAWFMFDSFMVGLMVFETWIMFTFQLIAGSGAGGSTGGAGMIRILRLLRLSRMMRMARLLRSMPELLILIKGMVAAFRSVFFTLLLLVLFIYVFAIYFRQMTAEMPHLRDTYFYSMAKAQHSLLIFGVFLDNAGNMIWDIEKEENAYHLLFGYYLFVLFATLTVMNMLIGVVCEVVSTTANIEQEEITIMYMKESLKDIVVAEETRLWEEDGNMTDYNFDEENYHVSKSKFLQLFRLKEVAMLLKEVEVDVFSLVDLVETIFATEEGGERELCFGDLIEVMLDQRTTNTATVKDLTDMRKYVKVRMDDMQEKCDDLKSTKEQSMVKLESQLAILGRMVEQVSKVAPGTFETTCEKEIAKAMEAEQAEEARLKRLKNEQEEEGRKLGAQLMEEEELAQAEEERKKEEEEKKNKWAIGGMSFHGHKKETE